MFVVNEALLYCCIFGLTSCILIKLHHVHLGPTSFTKVNSLQQQGCALKYYIDFILGFFMIALAKRSAIKNELNYNNYKTLLRVAN